MSLLLLLAVCVTLSYLSFSLWSIVFAAALLAAAPYLFLVVLVVAGLLPGAVGRAVTGVLFWALKLAFGLHSIDLDEPEQWGAASGPALHTLPPELCAVFFMRGNPAADGVGDMTWGDYDAATRTLRMPLSRAHVWSWNDDFEGVKLFYGAYVLGMTYVFHFNETFTRAEIQSPCLFGLFNFAELVYGRGSLFEMKRDAGSTIWTRESWSPMKRQSSIATPAGLDTFPMRAKAFPDYKPTRLYLGHRDSTTRTVDKANFALMYASMKDHPRFDPSCELTGGASARQMMRL
eukprot:gnl/Spiro4/23324_TR11535_c0_g1_i1.p1 gnl/Spiro4/23324_TR11535_c0_g1~~gnl/Spiro4/23324_TR11535_c0_g1_i1.p1  ORF type:complete len:310 (+),score=70.42 gnl/Spiro4/23324_TR11535_c0_g1_i1:62-931(+)